MKNIIGTILRCGGKTASYLLAAIFALAAAQSVQATVIDMGGASTNITNLGGYEYNGTAIKNNVLTNGTLNVTGNQAFADGTFTFGSGLTLNQTNDRWGISGGRTVKLMDGAKLNYTSKYNAYIGRLENGTTYNGTTQLILDNGTVDFSAATILFTPKASSSASGKNVVLNFTMINGSSLTTPNDKDMKLGAVDVANSKTHKTEKLTVAVTNSTLSVGKIIFGSSDNNLSDQDNSYINASFGPGADITCKQFYADSYPKSTIKFDGAVAHTAASVESDFFGKPSSSTFDGYELLAGGVTIDVTNSFEHGENFAPLFGVGGLTKTGSGTLTYNRDAFKFTGPLTVSNGTFVSSQQMAASAFNVDGSSSILNLSDATLTNATVSLSATAGGTLTLAGAIITDSAPDLMLAGGGTTDYFTRDITVGSYTFDSLTLGEGAVLDLDGNATAIDTISATTTNITATSANPATININFTAAPATGTTFVLFETDSADKFTVNTKVGSDSISNDVVVEDGKLRLTIVDVYTWGANQTNWGDTGAWTKGGNAATWSDGGIALFSTDGAQANLAADAEAAKVNFLQNATVSGSGTLTVPSVSVDPSVSAIISAQTAGALTKTGAGTLTLGASRTDQTTLTEGTLAMANVATVDPANLTLGTDAAKPVTFDYGGQTLTANPTAYLGPGMNVTLTNGVFTVNSDIGLDDDNLPATLTIAKDAKFVNSNRYSFNTDSTKTINIAGGEFQIDGGQNVWFMQKSSGSMRVNATAGAVIKTKSNIFAGTGHNVSGLSPKLEWCMNNSSMFIGKELFFGDRENYSGSYPINPECRLSMTNGVFYSADGISIGRDPTKNKTQRGGYYIVEFDDSIVTSKCCVIYGDRPASRLHYNGVVLVSSANNDSWIDAVGFADDVTPVTVGAKGLELNTNSKTMKINANLGGEGAVTKTGSGTLTITTNQTSTAALNVNEGTVAVDGGVTVARSTTVASGATFTVNATSQATVNTLTLEAGSTLNIASYAGSAAALSATTLTLPDSDTVPLTLNGGAFPAGTYKILEKSGIEVGDVEGKLVPSTGSEAGVYSIDGSTLVLTVGTPVHGRWVGANGGNFADPGSWSDGQVPVAADTLDFSGVTSNITINCGDLSETKFGAVTMGTGVITFTGSLTATSFSDTSKVAVGENSTVTLDDNLVFGGTTTQYIVYTVAAGGRFVVTGHIEASSDMTGGQVFQYVNPGLGAVQAKGLVANEGTSDEWTFRLSSGSDGTANWIVGADGLSGSKYFFAMKDSNKKAAIQPLDSDFTIATQVGIRAPLTFNTTGYDGNGHTITIAPAGVIGRDGALTISGTGKVLVDAVNTHSGGITVTDTATLAINAGKVATTGSITVKTNATLQVAESGTVALGGDLTLKNGAALGFNFTTRDEPVLDLSDKTVTFDEGATTNVVVKISADAGVRSKYGVDGKWVLTSGGKFAGVTVSLDETNKPDWALGVKVVDGDIVLDVKPRGMTVIIR